MSLIKEQNEHNIGKEYINIHTVLTGMMQILLKKKKSNNKKRVASYEIR